MQNLLSTKKRIYVTIANYNNHMQQEVIFAKAGVQSIASTYKQITIIMEEARSYLVTQARDCGNLSECELLCLTEQLLHFQKTALAQINIELYRGTPKDINIQYQDLFKQA